MGGAVVTVEVSVMENMEVAATSWPVETIMTEPGPQTAVHDDGEAVDGVEAEEDRDEGRGVVERGLHRVHAGAGEGSRVVGLVVEIMDLNRVSYFPLNQVKCVPVCRVFSRGPGCV